MRDADQQAHQLPGEASLSSRVVAEGYTGWSQLAENIYGYAESPIFAHAGFAVDWGTGPGGMQSPAGHRMNMMSSGLREIGISALAGLAGADLNPWIVTQDFGNRFALSDSVYVLGVLYDDANGNDFYNAGEGIGAATVTVAGPGGSWTTTTMTAGGYQVLLPAPASPATYTVTFSGGGLTAPMVQSVQVGTANVKVDGVLGATLTLALTADSVHESSSLTGTVTRSGSTSEALIVSLASSDPGEVLLPATVEIPAGLASAPFSLTGVADSLVDGNQRVTITATASGLTGAEADVHVVDVLPGGFTLKNGQLWIEGTSGDDLFSWMAGSELHLLTRNGTAHQLSSTAADTIVIRTLAGQDMVTVTGGLGVDIALMRPGWSRIDGANYRLIVRDAQQVEFTGDGADHARLYDGTGDDRFSAWPTMATMVGEGFAHVVRDVGRVYGDGTAGGADRAFLYDSPGDDILVARPESVILRGNDFFSNARGFSQVDVYAMAGGDNDRATLHDSPGDDRLVGTPQQTRLYGDSFDNVVHGFDRVHAYATAGGSDDRAILYDSAGDDTLVARPALAFLRGANFYNYARGFDRVYAYATAGGSGDRAVLHDSVGDDTLVAGPEHAFLHGTGFYNYARGFDRVYAYATAGGSNDRANLYDSQGSDLLVARPEFTYFQGDNFYNYAGGFERVNAYATAGGMDQAFLYDSAGDDLLVARPEYAYLRGTSFFNYARGFQRVDVRATAGGLLDRARLYDGSGDDEFTASADWGRLRGLGFDLDVRLFDRLDVYGTAGGQNRWDADVVDYVLRQHGNWL